MHILFTITITLVLLLLVVVVSSSPTAALAGKTTRRQGRDTPAMSWNSWNHFGPHVNATLMMEIGTALVSTGLRDLGWIHVNSDDAWMLAERDPTTHEQVPDPKKFPHGWRPVQEFLGGLGLKTGLYTARGPFTCQRKAGSCGHEALDAATYVRWNISYVKDDACSPCFPYTPIQTYQKMQEGLWKACGGGASLDPCDIILTVESTPPVQEMSEGGRSGNARRVGHDISPHWQSMLTLIDIGSGYAKYTRNSTPSDGKTGGTYKMGFFPSLDMLEIGNGPDFVCGRDSASLARCQYHFSMWCAMKSFLLLGNDLRNVDKATLSVISNEDSISINQDLLAKAARRVGAAPGSNKSLVVGNNFGIIRVCDTALRTQNWKFIPVPASSSNSSRFQGAANDGGYLQISSEEGQQLCLTHAPSNFYQVAQCPSKRSAAEKDFIFKIQKWPLGGACSSETDLCEFSPTLTWNSQLLASGPVPHSRYLMGGGSYNGAGGDDNGIYNIDMKSLLDSGAQIRAIDTNIINDNLVGNVTRGGNFCMDASSLGTLEVWAGPLEKGKISLVLANRSPGDEDISFSASQISAVPNQKYSMLNVWTKEVLSFNGVSMSIHVPSQELRFFILTPPA